MTDQDDRIEDLLIEDDVDPSEIVRSYAHGIDEVPPSVGFNATDRNLRTGQDDRLAQVADGNAESRGGVGHRIRTVGNDDSVEIVVGCVDFIDPLGQRQVVAGQVDVVGR